MCETSCDRRVRGRVPPTNTVVNNSNAASVDPRKERRLRRPGELFRRAQSAEGVRKTTGAKSSGGGRAGTKERAAGGRGRAGTKERSGGGRVEVGRSYVGDKVGRAS